MKSVRKVRLGSADVYIFPSIKGLVKEEKEVEKAIKKIRPNAVALPVSPEQLEALKKFLDGEEVDASLSHYEIIYAEKLSRYGKVSAPPPSYTSACKVCQEMGMDIVAIDMDEEEFAETFCKNVDVIQLYRQSVRWRFLKYRGFHAESPEEFVLLWDKEVNKIGGYMNVEIAREKYMAKKLAELADAENYSKIFAIIDYERFNGVLSMLSRRHNKVTEARKG